MTLVMPHLRLFPGGLEAAEPSGTILVVEDDPWVIELLVETLRRAGYGATGAADAREAISCLQLEGVRVRLLVTDVRLPGMSGPDLAEQAECLQPGLQCLFVSGWEADGLAADVRARLLVKPFSPEALLQRVEHMLAPAKAAPARAALVPA